VYFTTLLAFSEVYATLYKKNPRHFLFNADITERQKEVAQLEGERELSELSRKLSFIEDLKSALGTGDYRILHESAPGEVFSSKWRYKFSVPPGGAFPTPPVTMVEIFDAQDKPLASYAGDTLGVPRNFDQFRETARKHAEYFERRVEAVKQQLASIPTGQPQIWGVWDFLYFSLVIQTTIGFGDILPNSTLVRKLVILQTVINWVILVFFLNFVLGLSRWRACGRELSAPGLSIIRERRL
jgi:hypothetical protein